MACSEKNRIEVHGHRGYRGHYPENTLLGFHKAADLGVDVLELDICISKDHQVVVSHEPYMNPIICELEEHDEDLQSADNTYNLYQMTYDEIRQYDCGSRSHPDFPAQQNIKSSKPLLKDVFEEINVSHPDMRYNIEIKAHPQMDGIFTPEPVVYVNLVLDLIRTYQLEQQIILQSFDIRILEEVFRRSKALSLALLIDENEDMISKLRSLSFEPEIISPHHILLNDNLVQQLKTEGYRIIPWTVNEKKDLQRMIRLGVDGIITDYPDRLFGLIDQDVKN
ncbi:MAG: glycerophosphodiester phosphodiesterase [Flavobacteriaceae bacterium]|nr:glycerophosphodiester phosphodiesterase [Bacteroidia bacterium]MBT8288567.1 glycerophosphodiester phosphodiesterase [Bacteroidia bacterium]NNF76128.1 glycerophosphodiester phosphodiesterase [Flavobacteriaceae bacterium]NNK71901.1 glycerophosphodiester phosphodiesterase [Flavobacteriaceae bacterium]